MSLEEELSNPIARIRYPDAKTFKEFVEVLSKLLDEAKFTVTESGLKVAGMDPARVAYIEVTVPREAFLEYEIEEGRESADMGLNLKALSEAIEGKKGTPIEFRIAPEKVLILVEGAISKRFLLPNFEISTEEIEGITIDHDATATVLSDIIAKAINDIGAVSDIIEIEADEDNIVFKSQRETGSKVSLKLTRDTSTLIDLNVKTPSKAAFDISYLKNVIKLARIADTVDVKFSTEKPLELNFRSPDGSIIRYIVAPSASI